MLLCTEVDALLYLLEDPDKDVYAQIRSKILSYGSEILPELYDLGDESDNELILTRIAELKHAIHFNHIAYELEHWAEFESENLLKGLTLICSYQFQDLNIDMLEFSFKNIVKDIDFAIEGETTPLKITKKINQIIFSDYGFKVVNKEKQSINNYFPNNLFLDKKGEVINIAMLYAILTCNLDLPIYMIRVPNDKCLFAFFDRYIDRSDSDLPMLTRPEVESDILFYIDISRNGAILNYKDVKRRFFNNRKSPLGIESLTPLNNVETIGLLVKCILDYAVIQNGQKETVQELKQLKKILEEHVF